MMVAVTKYARGLIDVIRVLWASGFRRLFIDFDIDYFARRLLNIRWYL